MRVLLDECLPRGLAGELVGHDVSTVTQAGWSGVKNGDLLKLAAERFDALVTIDKRFAEGHLVPPTISIVGLRAPTNRIESLRPLVPEILAALARIKGGERIRVGA